MKVRDGFVSNSSSSSFLIYGVCFEDHHELVDRGGEKVKQAVEAYRKKYGSVEDEPSSWEVIEALDSSDFHVKAPYDGECGVYVGHSWHMVKDDETGAQFKARVEKELEELFGPCECSTHSEAWCDD